VIFAVHYQYNADELPVRDEHRPAHRAWLTGGAERGEVLLSGPYPDGSGALILIEADSADAAAAYMANDPFAKAGALAAVQILEYAPVMGALLR
jgi:uncharacterized protein YciI